jgi:hypothetical protein
LIGNGLPMRLRAYVAMGAAALAPLFSCGMYETSIAGDQTSSSGAGGAGGEDGGGCHLTKADWPHGSGNLACFCVEDSKPCEGLDEADCTRLGASSPHQVIGYCDPIYGSDSPSETGGSSSYLGCRSVDSDAGKYDNDTCAHPIGSDDCRYPTTTWLPDDGSSAAMTRANARAHPRRRLVAERAPPVAASILAPCPARGWITAPARTMSTTSVRASS